MGDEFDGCECVWSHEFAMQRLLNFIRQSQNHCTDTECMDISGRVREQSSSTGGDDNSFTFMTMFMVLAMIMYFIRPDSIMKLTNSKRGTTGHNRQDPSPPPPPPPPAIN